MLKANDISNRNKTVIVIGGPTASGKTSFAIDLAIQLNCEIISADSRQVYAEMHIGTAKPTQEELEAVPHHLIGHRSITESYSVGKYIEEALKVIDELHRSSDYVIVVGGTGLYLKGLIEGVDDFPQVDGQVVDELQSIYESEGITILQEELKRSDPTYYDMVDLHNPQRLIRALSITRSTGETYSSYRKAVKVERPWKHVLIALRLDRSELYDRINRRVDLMMDRGLLEEVSTLLPHKNLRSLDTVGYKELFNYLDGDWSYDQAVDKIKQHTRNYAKRQMTWFSNQQSYRHFHPSAQEDAMRYITSVSS